MSQQEQSFWKRQLFFKKYLTQLYLTENATVPDICPPSHAVTTKAASMFTVFLILNSVLFSGVVAHRCGGILNKPFAVALGVLCYVNLSWHYYGLEKIHVSIIEQ